MSNMRERFKISTLSFAILSSISVQAFAFEEEQNKDEKKDGKEAIEVIEVEGFRGSILKAMNNKRNSSNITDSIYAEDVGKSTDQNIADALSRVTGVSVQTEDGEGTKITVRGANPNQNMITLNGVQLTSSDFNQSVDLSAYSSDILSQINVVKTPSADHDEGSLGATVELKTVRPLEIQKPVRKVEVQGRYNDFSEDKDYKLSGSLSETFLDETIGFFVTLTKETMSLRRDQVNVNGYGVVDVQQATDQHGNIVSDTKAIAPNAIRYSLYENQRDRESATFSFQATPTENTNIMFDATYSKQDLVTTNHSVTTRVSNTNPNYIAGVPHPIQFLGGPIVPEFSDPESDWTHINTDTRTLTKRLNRFGDGGYGRENGGNTTENTVVSLQLEQYITDNFKVDAGVGYSKTYVDPQPSYNMGSLNSHVTGLSKALADSQGTPHTGIQPAGFDCTSGTCLMVVGNGIASTEDPNSVWDGRGTTAFNPQDTTSQAINNFTINVREIEDEKRTAFIDFDWDVDFAGLTKIEFGAKTTKHEKYVDDQQGTMTNSSKGFPVNIFDAFGNVIGQRIVTTGQSLRDIPIENYSYDGQFPADDFMVDLGVPLSGVTDGWPLISVDELLALATEDNNVAFTRDDSRTRSAEFTNSAAYIKVNFEPLDGLTGDVGVRYVKTKSNSFGFSGVTFPQDDFNRVFDPFLFAQLRDSGLPECQNTDPSSPNAKGWFNRIDGNGWDFNGTPDDPSDDTPIPIDGSGVYPCYDETTTIANRTKHWLWSRHTDYTHLRDFYSFGEADENGKPFAKEDRQRISFPTSGSNEYDMFLPSLNLNWAVTDEFIARFAASKTMSRPNIDSIKPGFTMTHGYWGNPVNGNTRGASINLFNPKLMPQESKNLDLSLEWYFRDASMISVGFFNKKLTDFEERELNIVYADDLRWVDIENGYNADNLVKTPEQIRQEWAEDPQKLVGTSANACSPNMGNVFSPGQDWWFNVEDYNAPIEWCSQFQAEKLRNGKGATIRGVEFNYQQDYAFLPGIWSGLGTTFNYTYSDSKTDAEFSSIDETKALPQLPQEWVPKHAYNATVFWEQNGHQLRLAYRGKSDELIQRSAIRGSNWREGSSNLDFSATYNVNENIDVTFQALNLTDTTTRDYFTSRELDLGDVDAEGNDILYDEGNALDGGVTKSRTLKESKTGRIFRLSLRATF